ncbi:MAG: hypothetical protein JKY71_08355 [Alphaproteobacteria bacterium]|nr:hypothetical protein [Alphaproteobacteria bacterium]
MALLDDSPSDFEAVTLALSAEDASGFDLSATDLTTSRGSNEILQLIAAGAGGMVAGVATGGAQNNSARTREEETREERESAYAYLATQSAIDYDLRLQELIREINDDIAAQAIAARAAVDALKAEGQAAIDITRQAYEDGQVDRDQLERVRIAIHNAEDTANSVAIDIERETRLLDSQAAEKLHETVGAILNTGTDTSADSARAMAGFMEMSSKLITLHIGEAHEGLPMRVAIHKDAETGSYYYIEPGTENTRVDITDPAQIRLIETQAEAFENRHFANDPVAGDMGTRYHELQEGFIDRIKSKGVGEQYARTFDAFSQSMESRSRTRFLTQQVQEMREEIHNYRTNFSKILAMGATPEQIETAISRLEQGIEERRQEIHQHNEDFQKHMVGFRSSFVDMLDELRTRKAELDSSLDSYARTGITNRDEQIRTRFPNEWTPPTDWNLLGVERTGAYQWLATKLITGPTANFAASNELEQAWRDDVVTHNGLPVYRDNNTLRLYTFDPDASDPRTARTYINDPATELRLNQEAYATNPDGTPSTDFKFFMNETPQSQDPHNTFRESFLRNLDNETVQQRVDQVGAEGEELYRDGDNTPETGRDLLSSLSYGFERSADATIGQADAPVTYARSGFDAGVDMLETFSRNARDAIARFAGLSDQRPSTGVHDDVDVNPDPTPKA